MIDNSAFENGLGHDNRILKLFLTNHILVLGRKRWEKLTATAYFKDPFMRLDLNTIFAFNNRPRTGSLEVY